MNSHQTHKLFFASDFHLGYNDPTKCKEKHIVEWLRGIPNNSELFLVGDIFDFWIEYDNITPNNHTLFFNALDEALNKNIVIYMFKGNHDMWIGNYFKNKGIRIIDDELIVTRFGKTFYLHHGDGLLKGDFAYKILKKILRSSITQKIVKTIDPKLTLKITYKWSDYGHKKKTSLQPIIPEEKICSFANSILNKDNIDYFILGHYHNKQSISINEKCTVVLLGDCLHKISYGVFDNGKLVLN